MLVDAVGADQVYPNDEDLAARPHGWYPGPKEFVDRLRSGQTHGATIFIGHLPFVLRDELDSDPVTVALLREPVARTLSMLKHRKLKSPRFSHAKYEEILDDTDFVDRQIRDYQTKIFAFGSVEQCPDTVNLVFDIDDERFERAVEQLRRVDILGLTEDLGGFSTRFAGKTGIELRLRRDNTSAIHDSLRPHEAQRIDDLTKSDQLLYREAVALVS